MPDPITPGNREPGRAESFREAREQITGDSWADDMSRASLDPARSKFAPDALEPDPLRLLWTASRDWTDPALMWSVAEECRLDAWRLGRPLLIVHGDAPGGDQVGKLFGIVTPGCDHEPHPADWEGPCREECKPGHRRRDRRGRDYCPAAGQYRNAGMSALGAWRCAAFIHAASAGASNCARLAERLDIPTRRYTA